MHRDVPPLECSTQLKVMAPSLLLSLKRSRKVPVGFSCSSAFVLSRLTKPMMELKQTWRVVSFAADGECLTIIIVNFTADWRVTFAEMTLTRPSKDPPGVFWSDPGFHRSKSRHSRSVHTGNVNMQSWWLVMMRRIWTNSRPTNCVNVSITRIFLEHSLWRTCSSERDHQDHLWRNQVT